MIALLPYPLSNQSGQAGLKMGLHPSCAITGYSYRSTGQTRSPENGRCLRRERRPSGASAIVLTVTSCNSHQGGKQRQKPGRATTVKSEIRARPTICF